MRFTTLHTLTGAAIISTIALLSLIQAANADGTVYLDITVPEWGDTFRDGNLGVVRWYVPKSRKPGDLMRVLQEHQCQRE